MPAVTRRQYKGAAAQTTITNALAPGDTSVTLAATTGWPSTAAVPFYVVISPGTSSEEKCSATISGSVLTLTRAQDDTTAQSHASGATIYPVFTADEADEANKLASTLTTRGDLLTMGSGPDFARIAIGASGRVLKSDGTDAAWAVDPATDLVTTKGDLLVGTAADTLARQGVGSNGTVLMADSGQTNGVVWTEQALGYRNVVINGAMRVAQRGTSTTGITSGALYYTADRMMFYVNSAGTWTTDIQNDAPTGSGFRKSFRALCTTADASLGASDELIFIHRIEGQNLQQFLKGTSSAKQFTLSFWVKSNATGTYNVEFRDEDNARHIVGSYTINASGTWEKKTITVAGDTTAAFDNDNGMSLQMQFWLAAGSNYTSGTRPSAWASSTNANRAVGQTNLAAATNNYWQITGVQLEAGAVATPFEFEDYGVTLAKCQRYYQKSYLDTEAPGTGLASSMWFSATNGVDTSSVSIPHLRTTMRSSPTMTVYHAVNGNSGAVYRTTDAQSINVTSINYQGSNGGGWIDLATDAENGYLYHYVFSAEL